jgi:hypothetical protein
MDDVYAALKVVADGSSQLVTWALALAAASVAAIVGSGYLRPSKAWRRIYLLFLPAWLFVGISVYFGQPSRSAIHGGCIGAKGKPSGHRPGNEY